MGVRLGCDGPKALVTLAGHPLIEHTLTRFAPLGLVETAVIICPPGYSQRFEYALSAAFPDARFTFVDGGAERQLSVENGLAAMKPDTDVVVIHDAARSFVAPESIQASIDAAGQYGAATVAIPSIDTILEGDAQAFLQATPNRQHLWACQTPQTFRIEVIRHAHLRARQDAFIGTDDASLVRRIGEQVKLVPGTRLNIKITTPEDLALAETLIQGNLV